MVDAAVRDFGFVDILVNNAGIARRGNSVQKTDPAELERVVRTHAFAAHHLCQLVLPSMKTRPRGDIVMISSVATLHHGAGGAPYNMGKAALEALAFTLAKEVRHHGVRVNVVAPGLVETEMGRRLMKATAGVTDLRSLDADDALRPRLPARGRGERRPLPRLGGRRLPHGREAQRVWRRAADTPELARLTGLRRRREAFPGSAS
jgi:NAD(P)-dependent dehydrogenase (short-subunit alcohol dehydrogenase family)